MNKQLQGAIMEQLRALTIAEQRRVLEFARALAISEPRGVSGGEMTRFAGTIANDDLALMRNAIEQGCEQVAKAR